MYPHSRSAEFGAVLDNGTEGKVSVEIKGRSGRVLRYRYFLTLEYGNWKISGVVNLPSGGIEI